jgi:hypothetical protein
MPRPKLNPTPDQRKQVKSFAAFGISHEDIAKVIGIKSPKTLRKHFRQELDLGAIEANARVAQTLFRMATSGDCPSATIYWSKCRAHWQEQPATTPASMAPPAFVVAQDVGDESK